MYILYIINLTDIAIVSTKADLLEEKTIEVSKEEGEQYATSKNAFFIEVSGKTGQGVEELFYSYTSNKKNMPSTKGFKSNKNAIVLIKKTSKEIINSCAYI